MSEQNFRLIFRNQENHGNSFILTIVFEEHNPFMFPQRYKCRFMPVELYFCYYKDPLQGVLFMKALEEC